MSSRHSAWIWKWRGDCERCEYHPITCKAGPNMRTRTAFEPLCDITGKFSGVLQGKNGQGRFSEEEEVRNNSSEKNSSQETSVVCCRSFKRINNKNFKRAETDTFVLAFNIVHRVGVPKKSITKNIRCAIQVRI